MTRGIAPSGHRLPTSTRVGTVRLQVADLRRSEEFYNRVLGMVTLTRGESRAAVGVPGAPEALVELVEQPGSVPVTPGGRPGLFHFAIRLPDRESLARFAAHVGQLGLRIGSADHLVSEALYLSDPDGLGIEVYADRPRSEWQWRGDQLVMATDPLDLEGLRSETGADVFSGLPEGTEMGHVHLHVGGLEEAAGFYHEALGLDKIVWDYPGALFLSAGGYHHHVGTNTWAAHTRPAAAGQARLLWWTLVLPDPTDVENAVESIASKGHLVTSDHGRWFAQDPWGTVVALVSSRRSGPEALR